MDARAIERFWSKVDVRGRDECWEWQASGSKGYGRLMMDGVTWGAHRLAFTLVKGRIPDGMCVLHSCDNPPCCNPAHLFIGTHADNMRDMAKKGRSSSSRKTHCPRGHALVEGNLIKRRPGRVSRECLTCRRVGNLNQEALRKKRARARADYQSKRNDPEFKKKRREINRAHYYRKKAEASNGKG